MTRRLLLVDDEPDVREVATLALELVGGYEVHAVGSGAEALAVLRDARAAGTTPDAVLLDVMMPDMDGPATLRALRALPTGAALPVLFFTATTQAAAVRALTDLGADGAVAKPFDPTTLADQIAAALGWA